MKIVVYGLTITSSWGNGHATTFRSLCKALFHRGHQIHFIEEDVEWYRNNRDLPNPPFCFMHLFSDWQMEARKLLAISSDADVVVVGSYFSYAIDLSERLFERGKQPVFFYDIDTPVTVSQLRTCGFTDYLRRDLIPHFAAYLSFTGGRILTELEHSFGAKRALPLYCSVDPQVYKRVTPIAEFLSDLSYIGTYAEDRQQSLTSFFKYPALQCPDLRFLVAGSQYPETITWPINVHRITHISPSEHASFYCSGRFTLNITRAEMIAAGWSPSVRLFEAAACGTAILSDYWEGLGDFFTIGEEILSPSNTSEIISILTQLSDGDRRQLGNRAQQRVLDEHTSDHRATQFEAILSECDV